MSLVRQTDGMRMLVDPNCVTIYMAGRKTPLLIERPMSIGSLEWEEFWSYKEECDCD